MGSRPKPPFPAIGFPHWRVMAGVADYTPLAAKTRHLPPSPARDLAEWRVLAGNGGLHAIARQNMPIATIVRPCPPKHTNNRRFHVLVFLTSNLLCSFTSVKLRPLVILLTLILRKKFRINIFRSM